MFSCSGEKGGTRAKNDLEKHDLKGKVKSLTEITYREEYISGQIQRTEMENKTFCLLNKKGKIAEEDYYSDTTLKNKSTFEYDGKGNLIEKKELDDNSKIMLRTIYSYDENSYDNKGNKIEEKVYNSDGSLSSKNVRKFDKNGNIVEEVYNCNSGVIKNVYEYENDDDRGNWSSKKAKYVFIKSGKINSVTITEREIKYYR